MGLSNDTIASSRVRARAGVHVAMHLHVPAARSVPPDRRMDPT